MKERFKRYLEQAFRKIRPTKAAMEYRLETLTKLEEAAQDYRIKGMTDDEAIYRLCIDSLGDFDAKLQEFDRNLTEVPKKNSLKRNIAVGAIGSVAAIIALYLILSLTGAVGWGMSWLILLGAVVAAVVAVDVVLMLKAFKDDKFLVARLFNVGTVILVFVFMYLCIHLSVHPGYDWYIFLCMVPAAGIMDIASDMEVFGPVVPIITFETDEEAVEIANQSKYGLSSCVITQDMHAAFFYAERIESSAVWINGSSALRHNDQPFGGCKSTGVGNEGAGYSCAEFTRHKTVGFHNVTPRKHLLKREDGTGAVLAEVRKMVEAQLDQ